jgi:hypothetical protein
MTMSNGVARLGVGGGDGDMKWVHCLAVGPLMRAMRCKFRNGARIGKVAHPIGVNDGLVSPRSEPEELFARQHVECGIAPWGEVTWHFCNRGF